MKKIGAFLVGVGLIAGVTCAADSNTATSVNIVGFISQSNTANKLYMINGPLITVGGADTSRTIVDLLGTNLPNGTIVYLWANLSYKAESLIGGSWVPGTNLINRCDGFWMKSTLGADVLRAGEVPEVTPTNVQLAPGLQMIGYPYPVSCALTNMGFDSVAANGDIIYRWNGASWNPASFIAGSWSTNYNFNAGEAFWYKRGASASTTNWVVNKPY